MHAGDGKSKKERYLVVQMQMSKKQKKVTIGFCILSKSTIAPETREETRGRGEYLYYPI